jgi:hypothetical protein
MEQIMGMYKDKTGVVGEFQEKEFKQHFEFKQTEPDSWGDLFGFPYRVAVGPLGETRYAKISKTVAYVVVDQDDNGDPVLEKWQINLLWKK